MHRRRPKEIKPRKRAAFAMAIACAVSLAACGGDAGEEGIAEGDIAPATTTAGTWGDADTDRDSRLAENEFAGYWRNAGLYDRWNTGGGEGLDREEVGRGLYGLWDRGETGLTQDEWNAGTSRWFADGTSFGTFGDWDANDNDLIEENEFLERANRHGLFNTWDANRNEMYEDDELFGGFFAIFDDNDDEYLDEAEWRAGYDDWDWGF